MTNEDDTLRYRLNYSENDWLESVVEINEQTGDISLKEATLPEGTTSFNIEVLATIETGDTTKVGISRIVVTIDKNEVCSTHPVEKSLTFATVPEEQKNSDIYPMTLGECEYELLSFTPNDKEYLFVDENQKLSTIELDRESEYFGIMTTPQIQAKLKLVCPDEDLLMKHRKRRAIDDFVDNVFTDEILFHSDITQLNIFIEDINDNPPVFTYPSDLITHIGYPDEDLATLLLPPYLIQVQATDEDEGLNAQITYSLNTNSNFGIDSKTGIIFPMTREMDTTVVSLTVTASDTVHESKIELKVHKITLDHLIVVYVENYGYHEMEDVLKMIKEQLGQDMHVLKYGNVPGKPEKRSVYKLGTRITTGTTLKLISYAFDGQNELVSAGSLLE